MEPDDLSFIEISGEDDSLLTLQQIPNDNVPSFNKTYFTCSPLLIPRSNRSIHPRPPLVSPIVGVTGKENEEDLNLSSRRDSVKEENTSMNKPEVPKLSMEPQQMKRKKKGGGYNLRKSLAWNRAFFTEEGVLDPLELSLISGNIGKSSGEMLSVIDEDRRELLAGESEDLTALEENLLKELPASTIKEDRKRAGSSLPKMVASTGVNHNVASTSAAKLKVLAAQDVNRSGSKRSGCARPVASSTLKRPANVNTRKTKELNVSKIPVRKPDPSAHPATVKSTIPGLSNLKRNQNVQPAVSVQRNIGLKSSSNNPTSARSNTRSGSQPSRSVVVKSSVQQARRNVASSALKIHSSTNSQRSLITKANDALKINPVPALPSSGYSSNNHDGDSNKIATSFPPKAPFSGGSLQHSRLQTAKPSGLRMPSPSLGFFNQAKGSSHSLLQRSNKACNVPESNIPNVRKFDASNVIHESSVSAPGKIPDIFTGMTSANLRVSGSVTGSSRLSDIISCSLEKTKSSLHGNATRKVELNVLSNSNSSDAVNSEQSLHICNDIDQQSLKPAEQRTYEKISHAVDKELQCSDNRLLLRSASSDQFMKDKAKERVANICPMNIELTGPKLENPHITYQLHPAVQVHGVFETMDMIDNKCEEEKMCSASIKDLTASSRTQSGDANATVLESQSGEANVYSVKGTSKQHDDVLSCAHDVNKEKMKQAEETMPSTLQLDQIKSESQSPSIINGTLYRESRSSEFQKCTSTKIANSSPEGNECVAGVDNFCTESEVHPAEVSLSVGRGKLVLGSSALDNMVVDVNEIVIDANGSELKSSGAICSKQPTQHDSGFDVAVEHPHGDDTKSGLNIPDFRHDIEPHGQTTSGMSQLLDKYKKSDVASNCKTKVPNVEHKLVEDKQCNFSINNHHSDSELQPGDDINYCQQNTSTVYKNQLNYTHVANTLSTEGNQIPEAYDKLLFEEHMPLEKSRESNSSEVVDVSLDAKSCFGRELESRHALFQDEYVKQTNEEVAEVGDTFKHTPVEDAQMQVLDGSLPVDSCNCNFNSSTVNDKSSVDVDDVHVTDPVAAQASLDAHGLCLGEMLIVNNCSSEELQEVNVCESVMDVVLHQSDACVSELSSVVCPQAALTVKNGGVDEDQKAEYPSDEDKVSGSVEIEPSVKNLECCTDTKFRHEDDELSSPTWSLTCGVSLNKNEGQNSVTANTFDSNAFCLQNKESTFSVEANQSESGVEHIEVNILNRDIFAGEASISQKNESSIGEMQLELDDAKYATDDATMSLSGSIFQDVNVDAMKIDFLPEVSMVQNDGSSIVEMQHESGDATMSLTGRVLQEVYVNSMTSDFLPEEAETIISQKNSSPNNEIHHELDDVIEDKDTTKLLKISGNDKKQGNLVMKPPPHAVPFSDEWLAAIEAAGEEILTMKRGAVQHSPPDKTQPEPGPWSPVKRKNNQGIGPYDCTKFTNNIPPSSS